MLIPIEPCQCIVHGLVAISLLLLTDTRWLYESGNHFPLVCLGLLERWLPSLASIRPASSLLGPIGTSQLGKIWGYT